MLFPSRSFQYRNGGGGFDQIWAEKADGHGLGPAINDRLFKASKK